MYDNYLKLEYNLDNINYYNCVMNIENILTKYFSDAFICAHYNPDYANVKASVQSGFGDFQCNGAMPCAKFAKKNPINIANEIIQCLSSEFYEFASIKIAKPGFINITLKNSFLAEACNTQLTLNDLGCYKTTNPKKVYIDFGGPNIAKPMHVGHIRSSLIGDALQRLYRFCGDKVVSDVHLGDWGTQMGMLINELSIKHPNLCYFDDNYKGVYPDISPVTVDELADIYPAASRRCKSDIVEMQKARKATAELQSGRRGYIALWRHFVDISKLELKRDFGNLGIYFDLWQGESDAQPLIKNMILDLQEKNIAVDSNGATVIELATQTNKIPPLILLKSDGAVMYGTTDLATVLNRINHGAEKIIYVTDKRQTLHFQQLFSAANKIGYNVEKVHVAFGTVNGKDNKPFKTRNGGTMRLSTLIEEARMCASQRNNADLDVKEQNESSDMIALATVKFADLANHYNSEYIFDLDKISKYEGKTGPYLLYSAVRIKSILKKIPKQKEQYKISASDNECERKLQLHCLQINHAIKNAYEKCEPHHLCDYSYNLAVLYNKFYSTNPILSAADEKLQESRAGLSLLVLKQLEIILDILGIQIPDKM